MTNYTRIIPPLFFLLVFQRRTLAFAPPRHDDYEPAIAHRRKNNITFDYRPSNLHPEVCKYLTEDECRHADASMKIQHDTHKHNQRLLETNPNFLLNIPVLLMQFKDHAGRELPEPWDLQMLLNLRVAEYLKVNSYNTYRVWFDVLPWQTTDNTEKHYADGKAGRYLEFQESFHPLLDNLYENDPSIDWSAYDNNDDGILDNLMVLTSSYAAELGKTDCVHNRKDIDRIWSHALADVSRSNWVSKDGKLQSNGYTIASAVRDLCGSEGADMGVVTHEFFHAIAGVIDLYDTATDEDGALLNRGRGGTGDFDIMSNPYGVGQTWEDFPSHMSPWTKLYMGWSAPVVANEQGTEEKIYTLRPSQLYDDNVLVKLENFFGYEYLLIENRQRKLFDIKLYGAGILIYHIDESLTSQADRGYPGQDGWPQNLRHYRVALLAADGRYDLEQLVNRGDADDFWLPAMTLGPNEDGETFPNTDTYGTSMGVYPTGVKIEILEPVGEDIKVKITIPSGLMMAPSKPGAGFLTPPKPANLTDQIMITDRFQADWFRDSKETEEEAQDQNQDQAEEQEETLPVGTGFVERPSDRPPAPGDEPGDIDSGKPVVTVDTVEVDERPENPDSDAETADTPQAQSENSNNDADIAESDINADEQPPSEANNPDEFVIALTPESESSVGETVSDDSKNETVTHANSLLEEMPLFGANQKEPGATDEEASAVPVINSTSEEIEGVDADEAANESNNTGADTSVFTDLFTAGSSEEVEAEAESDTEPEGTNDATEPPTQEVTVPNSGSNENDEATVNPAEELASESVLDSTEAATTLPSQISLTAEETDPPTYELDWSGSARTSLSLLWAAISILLFLSY